MINSPTRLINFASMKHVNSISQIKIDRDREIIRLYQEAKRVVQWPTTMAKICDYVSQMPTPCYYISFDAAYSYVRKRLKGIIPKYSKYRHQKKTLLESFYNDFLLTAEHERSQGNQKSVYLLVEITLQRPAPCLGLKANYIQKIISTHVRTLNSPFITK